MSVKSETSISIRVFLPFFAQVEARRIARTIIVPTLDAQVRAKLREIGEPITLFGERVRFLFHFIFCFVLHLVSLCLFSLL